MPSKLRLKISEKKSTVLALHMVKQKYVRNGMLWEFQKLNILIREGLIFGTNISEAIALVGRLKH